MRKGTSREHCSAVGDAEALEVEQGRWRGEIGHLGVQRDAGDLRRFELYLESVIGSALVEQVHGGNVRAP